MVSKGFSGVLGRTFCNSGPQILQSAGGGRGRTWEDEGGANRKSRTFTQGVSKPGVSLSFTVRLNVSFEYELDCGGLIMSSTVGLPVVALL